MKKLFVLFAVAAVMTACNNSAETAPAADTTAAPATEAPAAVDTTAAAEAAPAAAPAAEMK